jgi:hypothetical protein
VLWRRRLNGTTAGTPAARLGGTHRMLRGPAAAAEHTREYVRAPGSTA